MDLNRLALWFAAIPALTLFWRSARAPRRATGWLIVSALVLLSGVGGWFLFRDSAGYVSSVLLIATVLVPSWASNAAGRASEQQNYRRARLLSWIAAVLHPSDGWRGPPRVFRAFELAQAGRIGEAEALLAALAQGRGSTSTMAAAQRLRILGRWRDLKDLAEQQGLLALRTQPTLLVLYLRALGELGCVDELAEFMLAQESTLAAGALDQATLYLFAFSGQVELTRQMLTAKNHGYAPETQEFWLALATQCAGHTDQARRMFGRLTQSRDGQIRARAEERFASLAHPEPEVEPSAQTLAVVRRFARVLGERQRFVIGSPVDRSQTRVTLALVAINAAVYVIGSYPELLETRDPFAESWDFFAPAIFRGEWWRAFSYLFVHANALHLVMNLGGLWVLGPFVERAFGRLRFSLIYLVSGCTGSATYLSLVFLGLIKPEPLVGASGCIMGLLGATAAVMLRAWRRQQAPMARRIFFRLLAVVALQVAFDSTTPQVAGLAHALGLLGGFLCALLLTDNVSSPPDKLSSAVLR